MKNATVSARVEYDVKTQAEAILQQIGIPVSVAINSLYRQIIYQHGLPFALSIPDSSQNAVSEDLLNTKLEHSYAQAMAGEGRPFDEIFDQLERSFL